MHMILMISFFIDFQKASVPQLFGLSNCRVKRRQVLKTNRWAVDPESNPLPFVEPATRGETRDHSLRSTPIVETGSPYL